MLTYHSIGALRANFEVVQLNTMYFTANGHYYVPYLAADGKELYVMVDRPPTPPAGATAPASAPPGASATEARAAPAAAPPVHQRLHTLSRMPLRLVSTPSRPRRRRPTTPPAGLRRSRRRLPRQRMVLMRWDQDVHIEQAGHY